MNVSAAIPLPTHVILKVYDSHSRPRERRPENAVAWEAKKSSMFWIRHSHRSNRRRCPVNPSPKNRTDAQPQYTFCGTTVDAPLIDRQHVRIIGHRQKTCDTISQSQSKPEISCRTFTKTAGVKIPIRSRKSFPCGTHPVQRDYFLRSFPTTRPVQ